MVGRVTGGFAGGRHTQVSPDTTVIRISMKNKLFKLFDTYILIEKPIEVIATRIHWKRRST